MDEFLGYQLKKNDLDNSNIGYIFAQYAFYFAEYCRCSLSSKPSERHKHYGVSSGTKGVFFICGKNCQHIEYMNMVVKMHIIHYNLILVMTRMGFDDVIE